MILPISVDGFVRSMFIIQPRPRFEVQKWGVFMVVVCPDIGIFFGFGCYDYGDQLSRPGVSRVFPLLLLDVTGPIV